MLKDKILSTLDIPAEAAGELSCRIARGEGARFYNHRGVCYYSPAKVVFDASCGAVEALGEGLNIALGDEGELLIYGRLRSLVFTGEGLPC